METIKLMSASEAKEISLKSSITLENIANAVSNQAKNGIKAVRFFDVELSYNLIQILLELGYSVSKTTGPMKEDITVVSW